MEGKLLSNLMKTVPKATPPRYFNKKNTANRRVQINKDIEVQTLLRGDQQSRNKQQQGNPSTTRRKELQSTAHRFDKNFQDLVEEVNTKITLGYKIFEDSDRPNNLKVLYQKNVHLLKDGKPKQLQRRIMIAPYSTSFVEEHRKEARKCKAYSNYHWLAYISKGMQPAMNAEQSNTIQAVNDSESNNNYPTDNPATQTVQKEAAASGQDKENDLETSSAKQRRVEWMKNSISDPKLKCERNSHGV